jgi:hypothetical protein
MKRNTLQFSLTILILSLFLAGCGGVTPASVNTVTVPPEEEETAPEATAAPALSTTPDLCSLPQLEAEVQKVHRHMREFDDASILASNMPREQLSDAVADLQRIRREAEDEQIPDCLLTLKTHQVDHMNSVIDTLVAFMGGTEQQTLEQGIAVARQQHDDYTIELARLLGLTVVPADTPAVIAPSDTPAP